MAEFLSLKQVCDPGSVSLSIKVGVGTMKPENKAWIAWNSHVYLKAVSVCVGQGCSVSQQGLYSVFIATEQIVTQRGLRLGKE